MKKGLLITVLLMIALFLAGAVLIVIGIVRGGSLAFTVDFMNQRVTTSKDRELLKGEVETDSFDAIYIDVDAADFSIVEGDTYMVKYQLYDDTEPVIEVKDGVLNVKRLMDGKSGFIGFDFAGFNDPKEKTFVELTVPKGTSFGKSSIIVNAGSVKVSGYDFAELNLEVDAGDIDFSDMTTDSLDINIDAGDITLNNINTGSLTIDNDAGAVNLDTVTADTFEADNNFGAITINKCELKDISLSTDTGDIDIKELRCDKASIEADVGAIDLNMIGEEADYDYELGTDAGNVKVAGNVKGDEYQTNNGKSKQIKIENDCGDITITFN